MSDATDNRFYREPAAPVVDGDPKDAEIQQLRAEVAELRQRKQADLDELKRRLGLAGKTLTAHCKRRDEQDAEIERLQQELAEAREFGNDAMNRAQEIGRWVEGYGKLSADNKRLTGELASRPAIPADGGYSLTAAIVVKLQRAEVELSLEQRNFLPQIVMDWLATQAAQVSGSDTTEVQP